VIALRTPRLLPSRLRRATFLKRKAKKASLSRGKASLSRGKASLSRGKASLSREVAPGEAG